MGISALHCCHCHFVSGLLVNAFSEERRTTDGNYSVRLPCCASSLSAILLLIAAAVYYFWIYRPWMENFFLLGGSNFSPVAFGKSAQLPTSAHISFIARWLSDALLGPLWLRTCSFEKCPRFA